MCHCMYLAYIEKHQVKPRGNSTYILLLKASRSFVNPAAPIFATMRWLQLFQDQEIFSQLQNFYQNEIMFPIEVRYFLCQWFEEKNWDALDPDNPSHAIMASELLKEMCDLLISKSQELTGDDLMLMKFRLVQTHQTIQTSYQNNAPEFLRVIKRCMDKETELLQLVPSQSASDAGPTPMEEELNERATTNQEIMKQLQELNENTQETDRQYKEMQHKQERFIIQYKENSKISGHANKYRHQIDAVECQLRAGQATGAALTKLKTQLQEWQITEKGLLTDKKRVETQLSELGQLLLQLRMAIAERYRDIIDKLQNLQRRVLDDELIGWKKRQQLGGNGMAPQKSELDMLQTWCEHLAEIIWNIRQQIKRTSILRAQLPITLPQGIQDILPELNDVITGMLSSLVTSTFVVEQQPPQVLKKDSRFMATIRLLVGGKLNIQMNAPQVRATIISENQAKNLLRSDMKAKLQTSGQILNDKGTMDFHSGTPPSSGSLSITFRNMQLKNIQRSDKKGSEAVTEEKFCILFQSDFNVQGMDLVFQVWTLSLPVVVTVHVNQECNAMATVLWDNAFSEPGRVPFVVPDSVPWPKMGEQLHMTFLQATNRGLNKDSLDYLASKIFGTLPDYSQSMISWVQFNKESLKDNSFTFWEWFYAVLKLTKEHLKGPWTDGSIMGFMSKGKAQECLNQRNNGTFLLRFSDSECGGITVAWIAESQSNPKREVWNLAPYITKDFAIRGLADRIHDFTNLVSLYPDRSKDEVFSKYYTVAQDQEQPNKKGYVKTYLVNVMGPTQTGGSSFEFTVPSPATSSIHPNTPLTADYELPDDLLEILESLETDYEMSDLVNDANALIQLTTHHMQSPY